MVSRKLFFVIAGICIFFLSACGPKAVAPEAEFDTPAHHVKNGHKLLKAGKIDAALREFNWAKDLDPKYSPAYVGLGLVQGVQGEFDSGFKAMKMAQRYADGKEQKVAFNVGYMRLYIMGGEKVKKNWLKEVNTRFNNAIRYIPDLPEPYFYMGVAYKNSYKFQKAAANFTKVLELDKGFVAEADNEYAIVQKIQRAMPGSEYGKKTAALFIEELEIDALFKKRTPKKFATAFKDPTKEFAAGEYVKTPPATDIENHVLKADIDAVIAIGIKGLQPGPDHTFQPEKVITRAEFAMMIEDILIKITGDNGLATKFIGNASPFPDLRNDLPFFNAAMVCTTRNIMETKDVATGEFAPMEPVTGAEALLSIRALKTQL
jgi:hypothetical protein